MYSNIGSCVKDLLSSGQLLVIEEEVNPDLLLSEIQRQVYRSRGKAILFKNVKGSKFPAVCNLFGTVERTHYIFRKDYDATKELMRMLAEKKLSKNTLKYILKANNARIKKKKFNSKNWEKIQITDLPLIKSYPMDGGAFVTLPIVCSMGIDENEKTANLGMYRIQLTGNDYRTNEEIGLHYQIHRGIGVHHKEHLDAEKDFYVSIFIGGPPSHSFAAVMPLPENMSELSFAGLLGGRRFAYSKYKNYLVSEDSDFCILGKVKKENMAEGPFGDHLGYYSMTHPFPAMEVECVLAKPNAIWSFTTVGRPPQEDTSFGHFIHSLAKDIIKTEIAGVKEINAVDEAGVHPLLLAVGSERYSPFYELKSPQELLSQANALLGKGQLSLAKYLFISNFYDDKKLSCKDPKKFFTHILERINLKNDIHLQTKTTIDTLDYSSKEINYGSKVIFVAVGKKKRDLADKLSVDYDSFTHRLEVISKGILAIEFGEYSQEEQEREKISDLVKELLEIKTLKEEFPLIILSEELDYMAENFNNFLWMAFTRSNPADDFYAVGQYYKKKHWGCEHALIIDTRKKPHHAPTLCVSEEIQKRASQIIKKYENS